MNTPEGQQDAVTAMRGELRAMKHQVDEVHMAVVGNASLGVEGLVNRIGRLEGWRNSQEIQAAKIAGGVSAVMVAVGFLMVCAVCVFAAPTQLDYSGVTVPPGLSHSAFQTWAGDHADEVICDFNYNGPMFANVPCGPGPESGRAKER